MEHEWKIGDWCELHGKRYLVFKRSDFDVWAIGLNHGIILFLVDDEEVKHLPDCTDWDWQPPKPEPQYRPFANAAELEPHRERWITYKHTDPLRQRIGAFNDKTVWPACAAYGSTYEQAFQRWQFEDGTPFGIIDDAKPSGSGSK